ncbi:MAG TPA: hypothetical protein VK507_21780, partial [Iamia sp.]|nr:hypothetical protein [Iamia sp.]
MALIGAAVVVAVAVAAAVIVRDRVADDDDSPYPDEWAAQVQPIADWVVEERELEFEHPVEVDLLTEDEYADLAADQAGALDAEEEQEAEDTVALLRALGLASGEVDLEAAGTDLLGKGSLAFYSYEEERVYVRGDELTPSVRVTLAHELTHVLQDQHFDLGRAPEGDDEAGSLRAIAEGDANRIGDEYAEEELTSDERDEHEEGSAESSDTADEDLADVPPALVALSSAPYTLGEGFLAPLEDDNAAIDDVLEDPPSEQELVDPQVRGSDRAEPVEVTAPEAPDGAEVVDEDTFGAVTWFLLLATRGEPADALAVVDGWGGDAFVSYREDDRVCVEVVVAGDDDDATATFRDALDAWAAQDPSGAATIEEVDDGVRLRSCDPGEDAEPVGEVPPDVIAFPLIRAQIEDTIQGETTASPEEARCASDRILDELSF